MSLSGIDRLIYIILDDSQRVHSSLLKDYDQILYNVIVLINDELVNNGFKQQAKAITDIITKPFVRLDKKEKGIMVEKLRHIKLSDSANLILIDCLAMVYDHCQYDYKAQRSINYMNCYIETTLFSIYNIWKKYPSECKNDVIAFHKFCIDSKFKIENNCSLTDIIRVINDELEKVYVTQVEESLSEIVLNTSAYHTFIHYLDELLLTYGTNKTIMQELDSHYTIQTLSDKCNALQDIILDNIEHMSLGSLQKFCDCMAISYSHSHTKHDLYDIIICHFV